MSRAAPGIHRVRGLTNRIPVVPVTYTLAEVQSYLFAHKGEFDTVDYIYVTDSAGKLLGVFSIKDIYRHPPPALVGRVYKKSPLATASPGSHPEEIANTALTHGIKAVPVVDEQGKLLGIVPHDTITRVLHRELREDILHLAGVNRGVLAFDNVMQIPLLRSVGHRLPWLVAGTVGGLAIARIITQYEQTLRDNLVLAAFIPLVVYVADAVGTQLEAFAIRDFALFRKLDFPRYFARHLLTVLVLAVLLGVTAVLMGLALYRRTDVAAVLGLAVGAATVSALFSGLLVPFLFRKMKVDPANASGPLGTIIQDTVSVAVYFSIATWLL